MLSTRILSRNKTGRQRKKEKKNNMKKDKEKNKSKYSNFLRNRVYCVKLYMQLVLLILASNTSFVSIKGKFVVMENLFCTQEQEYM